MADSATSGIATRRSATGPRDVAADRRAARIVAGAQDVRAGGR